jgi:1-acyl-sn-glycerol-3-phosphate acyltransferase
MGVVRALLYHLAFYGGSVPLVLLVALGAPFSEAIVRRGARAWATWFVWTTRVCLGVRLVVRGAVPNRPVIVASKHQSAYETILTLYLFDRPAVVMKAELRGIPLWGFIAARHGSIFVERGRSGGALKGMLRQARARSAEGRPVFIFPEGTRVPPGEAPPLKAGLVGLYQGLDVPVVPLALDSGRVWTKGFVKRPGTVTLAFLPDVPPGLERTDLEARVHAAINADPVAALLPA